MKKVFLFLLLLLSASPAWATYTTPLAHTIKSSADSNTVTTDAINTTGANLIVIGIAWYTGGGTPCTPTDSTGMNTWSPLTTYGSLGTSGAKLFYAYNPTTSSTQTFTCSSATSFPVISVQAWAGAKAAPFDLESGANTAASAAVQASPSITPTEDNEVVIAVCSHNDTNFSIDSGYTESDKIAISPGAAIGSLMAYLVQTSAAATQPTCTASVLTGLGEAIAVASFKASPATASSGSSMLLMGVGH